MRLDLGGSADGRTFASVRKHRNYRLYFGGQAVSFIGTWMQQIAAAWLVLAADPLGRRGGRARARADAAGDRARPLRRHADRPRRRPRMRRRSATAVLAVVAAMLAVLALPARSRCGRSTRSRFVQGVWMSIGAPARHTLVFQIVGRDDLANAVGAELGPRHDRARSSARQSAAVVAAAGPGVAFAVNAGSYLVVDRRAARDARLPAATRRGRRPAAGGARRRVPLRRSAFAGSPSRSSACSCSPRSRSTSTCCCRSSRAGRSTGGAATFGLIAAVFGAGALVGR